MDEEQMLKTNTLHTIGDILNIPIEKKSKFQYEFQELCTELEPIYGKVVWTLPYKYSESKIRRAHKIATDRGIQKVGYLIGIMKKDFGF